MHAANDYLTTTDATHLTITDGTRLVFIDFTGEPTDAPTVGEHWETPYGEFFALLTPTGHLPLGGHLSSRDAVAACYAAVA